MDCEGTLCFLFSRRSDCIQHLRSATARGFSRLDLQLHPLSPYSPFIPIFAMDVPEPNESPFPAVSTHTSKLTRVSVSPVRGPGRRNYSPILCTGAPACPTRLFHTDPYTSAISILPRCLDSLHDISLGWYRCPALHLLLAHRFCSRMVHRYVSSQPISQFPIGRNLAVL